jgi:LuxR family transcriptional regulator
VFHLAVLSLPARAGSRLTPRQREVLEWVAQGKTVPEISLLIDRKRATVEKHLRLAREALNARSTAQAVLKASVQKEIFAGSDINVIDFTDR